MTLKQLRDRVVAEIGLQDIEDYNETTMVDDLIYQGTIDLLARTRCVVRCLNLRLTKDESTYILDKSILALVDIENGDVPKYRRDEHPFHDDMLIVYPAGYTAGSTPRSFQMIRSDVLRITPAPTEDGKLLNVWAVVAPTKMSNDTDSLESEAFGAIPLEYQDAVFFYACWHGASYADDESGGQGERYRMLYEGSDGRGGKLAQIKMLVNKRGTARAARRRVSVRTVRSHDSFVG